MSSRTQLRASTVALVLLLGCSGSDLTLPESNEPDALTVLSGDGQEADAGALLREPLTVRVVDASSRPVAGAEVAFSFLGELPGAGLDPASVLTDADGRAAAIVRLGEVVGEQVIVAQVTSSLAPELRARFSATALAPDDRGGGKKDDKHDENSSPHGGSDDGHGEEDD
ncbi:MAG TPA: Ig-like domain-containing protein [Gemmatimonadales bacterium]|nr:Ig-like domain-containing protein [Gemmatimonadales bacterium]